MEENDLVCCPYDPNHQILRFRLNTHLLRCSQSHRDTKLVTCPYNNLHLLKKNEVANHILCCKSGAKVRAKENVEPVSPAPPRPILVSSEDWDNEPPVPTYNPDDYCKNNLIVRQIQGAQPAVRRKFRDSERLRLSNLAEKNEK